MSFNASPVLRSLIVFIKIYLLGILLFTLNRIVLLLRFAPEHTFEGPDVLAKAFLMGFRFDTKSLLVLMLPIVAIALFTCIDNKNIRKFFVRFTFIYSLVMLSLAAFLLMVDQQYYLYFQSHFNVLIFAFIQDDTMAIIVSMWEDHPFVRIVLLALLAVAFLYLGLQRLLKNELKPLKLRWHSQLAGILLFGFALFSGIRGTYSTFPLEKDDLSISDDVFINYLASNAIFSIQMAFEDNKKLFTTTDNQTILQEYGYESLNEALKDYYGGHFSPSNNPIQDLYTISNKDTLLENRPPHVVFVLMESMSNYYLDFHNSDSFNLLGALENHFREDYLFRNFLSGENGTISSLEDLMINMPEHAIAQSPYKYHSFSSSVAKPYKDAGYSTIFMTSGKQTWRNLDEFVPINYFDTVYSKSTVLNAINDASECEWGVFDEYMFEYAHQLLNQASQPTFLFILTTTNHTPFERPSDYKPYPLQMEKIESSIQMNHNRAEANFLNYQYSNNALGVFLNKIKQSPLQDKTVVGASGDHNTWMLFQYNDSRLNMQYGVPFYLYIPTQYQRETVKDLNRFGSHKDIFPTLISNSLSGARYLNTGNNLLANDSAAYFGVNSKNVLIAPEGAIKNVTSRHPEFFEWQNNLLVKNTSEPSNELLALYKKGRAREFLLKYYFNEIVNTKP